MFIKDVQSVVAGRTVGHWEINSSIHKVLNRSDNNTKETVYGAVIMTMSLPEFLRTLPSGCRLSSQVSIQTQSLAFSPVSIQTQRTQRKRLRLDGNLALDQGNFRLLASTSTIADGPTRVMAESIMGLAHSSQACYR